MKSRHWWLTALAAAGAAYAGWHWQRAGERRDRDRLPPPGRLIDVDRSVVHVLEEGAGVPTVVLVNDLGGTCLDWDVVAPQVAAFARVLRFDRPGLGWSEGEARGMGPGGRAESLRRILLAAGMQPPYVLVGWSLSAFEVRLYAGRYPEEVAGAVLVDAEHEDVRDALPWRESALSWAFKALDGVMRAAGELGVARLLGPQYRDLALRAKRWLQRPAFPDSTQSAVHLLYRSRRSVRAIRAETEAWLRAMAEMKALAAQHPFPDIPLTVVAHGFDSWRPNVQERSWHGLQERLAALSTQGKLVFASGAGHRLPLDRPDAVVQAIRGVVEATQARSGRGLPAYPFGNDATLH